MQIFTAAHVFIRHSLILMCNAGMVGRYDVKRVVTYVGMVVRYALKRVAGYAVKSVV